MANSLVTGTAFITGSGSGIGRATSLAYARCGISNLAISDIDDGAIAQTASLLSSEFPHVQVLALHLDTTKEQAIREAVAQTVAKFGRIDVAINVAGIGHGSQTMDTDLEAFEKVMAVNASGVWLCQREEIRVMLQQENKGEREGRGVIINVASVAGLLGGVSPAYTASKHAVLGITKNDTLHFAPRGIRINAICPGWVRTPMTLAADAAYPGFLEAQGQRSPIGRVGQPEEIADCLVFLGSKMSSYMHGVGMVVDGGTSIGLGKAGILNEGGGMNK